MKKLWRNLLALMLALLLAMGGLAEGLTGQVDAYSEESIPYMVVNCDEWVSMREETDTHSETIAHVPLGAIVNVYEDDGIFAYCEYEGSYGYILSNYLEKSVATENFLLTEFWKNFEIDKMKEYMRSVNQRYGYELLQNIRIEPGDLYGYYDVVADISGLSNGKLRLSDCGYLTVSADYADYENSLIEELYSDAGAYFIVRDPEIASQMYLELKEEFEEMYKQDPNSNRIYVDSYESIGRYIIRRDEGDGSFIYMVFMGELQ